MEIKLEVTATGGVQMLHSDAVDLSSMGDIIVERASHVEFEDGAWFVESHKTGECLASRFKTRAEALAWEKQHYCPGGAGWKELTEREGA